MGEPIRCTYCGKHIGINYSGQQDSEGTCNECRDESDRRYSPYPQMV